MYANNLVVPGCNWDAALPSGNPHGSGMSECAAKLPAYKRMTWNTLVKLASLTVSANLSCMGRVYKLGGP